MQRNYKVDGPLYKENNKVNLHALHSLEARDEYFLL